MINEGTYPYVHGGVSVWCDRLIRELPDIDFAVYGISPSTGARPVWDFPPNVVDVHPIELSRVHALSFNRYLPGPRRRFLESFDALLEAVLSDQHERSDTFVDALKGMYLAGREIPIDICVRSEPAYDLVRTRWNQRLVGDRFDQMGKPSLNDVLDVTSSLSRFLRPLEVVPVGDIAHTTASGLSSLAAFAAKWENGTPILLTEHGVYLRERFIEAHNSKAQDRVKAFFLMFFRALNDATIDMAEIISPVSDYNARWELEMGASSEQIVTINNGVDPANFDPIETEPDVLTVSWIGRVDPLKDLPTLIRSFAYVHEHVPEARLRLFGPVPEGNEGYHAMCVKVIEDNGLDGVVFFEGLIRPANGAFEAGHIVALSSISEGFPFTVIEAMMSGRATVSTDVGGVAEVVGDAGLLVPPRDPEAMGKALVSLLVDDERRRSLGAAARDRAFSKFRLDLMARRYRHLYEDLLAEPARPVAATKNIDVEWTQD